MNYKKNFKLVPIDDVSGNLENFKNEMLKVLHDPELHDNTKAARFEDLYARYANYRTQIDVTPSVRLESGPDVIEPPFIPPEDLAEQYTLMMQGMKSNSKGELVLNNRVIPGSNFKANLDYAEGLTDVVPYGYPQLVEYIQSTGTFPIRKPPTPIEAPIVPRTAKVSKPLKISKPSKVSKTPRIVITPRKNAKIPVTPATVVATEHEATPIPKKTRVNSRRPTDFDTTPVSRGTRKQKQHGKGRQRLYVKLWKL